jgi:copper chaperone CopZ
MDLQHRLKKESYLVEGMSCSGCERSVQRVIGNLKGVSSAKADLSTATVSFEYDPSEVSLDVIKSAVNKIGYKIVGERAPDGKREGRDDAVS